MVETKNRNPYLLFLFPAIGSIALYVSLGYILEREESIKILAGYFLLFLAYISFIFNVTTKKQVYWLLALSLIFRMSLFVAVPNLSDDFYRFIWDGRLLINGIHPFANIPEYYMINEANIPGLSDHLFSRLNSPEYFTIYPPVYQLIFAVSALIFPDSIEGSIIIMRLFILLAEAGTIFYMLKSLKLLRISIKNSLLYALNPLVIIELTGNLHFEAILIFFLVASFYYFYKNKNNKSALFFSLAVCTKLIPLIFLPLFIRRLGIKNFIIYSFIVAGLCVLIFLPLFNEDLIKGFSSSFLLYFQKFEFNASIYYLIRGIGYWIAGYNLISFVGILLGITILFFTILYAKKENLSDKTIYESSMWVLLIYLLLATTLHPWYIVPLLALSVFTKYRFTIVWSLLIFFTYMNYTISGFYENLWIVFLEYAITLLFLYFELSSYNVLKQLKNKIRARFLEENSIQV